MNTVDQKTLVERYESACQKPKEEYLPYIESLFKEGLDPNYVKYPEGKQPDNLLDCFYLENVFCAYKDSRIGLELIKLFIKYGFDIHRYEGYFGASLLYLLEWFPMDEGLVEATDYVLQLGVNPLALTDSFRTAIFDLDETAGDGRLCGWYHLANSSEVVARMVHRYLDGKPYDGIGTYQRYIGKKVSQIRLGFRDDLLTWFKSSNRKDLVKHSTLLIEFENETAPLLFVFGETVVIDPYWDTSYWKLYQDDWNHWRMISSVYETNRFDEFIGQTFTGLYMEDRGGDWDNVVKEGIQLKFSNGLTIDAMPD